ncbi:hypothetical protein BaOVIS_010860 [Babesia ovis]|uniref:Uncharacterized protein n=1 Tax=Babesia ovis TaxID=5869 RepID=A0A9W5WUX0_BABOV|nr:hypothetical protein BaOVIS_010860 [Babesia ovis]
MIARNARSLCSEWAIYSSSLHPEPLSKALNRIALNFWRLPRETDLQRDHCLKSFLDRHVIRSVFPNLKLSNGGQLALEAVLQPLQDRALFFGNSDSLRPKDVSLILNAYAKIYQTIRQSRELSAYNSKGVPKLLRRYALELIPTARSLVAEMNEQDLSLVLNSMSKLGITADELLLTANNTLMSHLREHYKHESRSRFGMPPKAECNLISQMTPQGASLIINCFAKSNVPLDEGVLKHIVNRFLPANLENFLPQQLVTLLHGFMKLNVKQRDVLVALKHLDKLAASECEESNAKMLSASLYTFGKYNHFPVALASNLAIVGRHQPLVCSELELSNMYYGIGKLNIRCEAFLEKLNERLLAILDDLTPQGLSTAYYALSRLEVRYTTPDGGLESNRSAANSALLYRFMELVRLNKDCGLRGIRRNSMDTLSTQLLPLHLVNVSFSAATSLVVDNKLFGSLLDHLEVCFRGYRGVINDHKTKQHGTSSHKVGSDVLRSRHTTEMVATTTEVPPLESDSTLALEFIQKQLGTQGIYQLYCICQHIIGFTADGLRAQRFNVLMLLLHLFDAWERVSRDRFTGTFVDYQDDHDALVDPDITTSRIQSDVFSVLKTMLSSSGAVAQAPTFGVAVKSGQEKETMIVEESQAAPYVIDILLYSV